MSRTGERVGLVLETSQRTAWGKGPSADGGCSHEGVTDNQAGICPIMRTTGERCSEIHGPEREREESEKSQNINGSF